MVRVRFRRRDRRGRLCGGLLFVLLAHPAQAQSNGNVGGFAEIGTSNPYPYSSLTFIGTAGHLRAISDLDLGSQVATEIGAEGRLSAATGTRMIVSLDWLRSDSVLYLGSATDRGQIEVQSWSGRWNSSARLVIDGGTVVANTTGFAGLNELVEYIASVTISNGATLYLGSQNTTIRRLEGNGQIGLAGANLTIRGGTFSTGITGASTLTFSGDSTWTGTGSSVGTLAVLSGVTLTTNNPAAVESTTALRVDGTYELNSALAVDGLSGSGTIALGTGSRLTAGSQNSSSTFDGTISGSGGGLTKAGTGTLTLTGASSYTGATIVEAGTLAMGRVNALPMTSPVTVNGGTWSLAGYDQTASSLSGGPFGTVSLGGARLTLGGGADSAYQGTITGTGGLTKIGGNRQELYGSTTYSGPTVVSGGLLRLYGTLPNSQSITVHAGAELDAPTANALSTQARVTLTGSNATLRISGDQSIGALDGTSGARVLFGAGRTLTLGGGNGDGSFAGTLGGDGQGSITKIGTGTLALAGTSGYQGATLVNAGTLVVNGSIAASSGVTLNAGAVLGGSGTVPSVTVTGGTLSPGNSPGTLTIAGDLTLDAASTYRAEVQGAVSDRLSITGTAALAGRLQLVPLGGSFTFNSPYTLLSAAGGRSGSFGTVETVGSFGDGVTSKVSYTAQDVQLTLAPKPLVPIVDPVPTPSPGDPGTPGTSPGSSPGTAPPLSGAAPPNVVAIASRIDEAVARGADVSRFFPIYNLPAAAIPAAVNQLSGEVHTAAPAIGQRVAGRFLDTMLAGAPGQRLQPGRLGSGPAGYNSGTATSVDAAAASPLEAPRFALWGEASGGAGRTEGLGRLGTARRAFDDMQLAVGADLRIGSESVLGVALSGGTARASLAGGLGRIESDIVQLGLYGRTRIGAFELGAAAAFGRIDHDVSRSVPVLDGGLTASYAGTHWSGRLEARLPVINRQGLTLSPVAALQRVAVRTPAFVERAFFADSAAALAVAGRRDGETRVELGLQLQAEGVIAGLPATGHLRAAWAHDLEQDTRLAATLTALPGASFVTRGAQRPRNSALVAAGFEMRLSERLAIGLRGDGEISVKGGQYSGMGQIRVSF
jgi:autotransporter-associated beta strand protein